MDENKDIKEVKFIVNDNVENVFTDLIQLNITHETVKIMLAIKEVDSPSANISHNIIMTLPHFLRFADVCNQSAKKIISQIESQKKES